MKKVLYMLVTLVLCMTTCVYAAKKPTTIDIKQNENIANNLSMLQGHEQDITNNTSRINGLESRIEDLEETAVGAHTEVELYDSRYITVGTYVTTDVRHGRFDNVMIKFKFKPFKSYELKRIEQLEKHLEIIKNRI